ncbi:DUF21-domain-containing protein, protein [Acrodontium crateriforme]|uniref:DUF21-domain-containing protein, protein n=1 Tax=Acrodontium crateriforme TaxID=150365 RepID=A0AAQ3M6T6_9PEZI|nr:DUF21-domain-containing protein, protein [Acrodontium crateriforme]
MEHKELDGWRIILSIIAIGLVCLGGLFAGLTIALFGQDDLRLHVIASNGTARERADAQRVVSLFAKGKHWILVTLLLSNVVTNAALTIILDQILAQGWSALLSSTALIVIFGEVLPQSVGVRFGLSVGAFFSRVVLFLMYVTSPVTYPTAKFLDYVIGSRKEMTIGREGFHTLLSSEVLLPHDDLDLSDFELDVLRAVLQLHEKPICHIMKDRRVDSNADDDTLLSESDSDLLNAHDEAENLLTSATHVETSASWSSVTSQKISNAQSSQFPEVLSTDSCLSVLRRFEDERCETILVKDSTALTAPFVGEVSRNDILKDLLRRKPGQMQISDPY